ncbi:FadR family transcriptional regulator [Mycolicibacterium farcinogenes]|uniref:FadR/GntR family transcriptional regulator n=1 Tax=Mycolicibacterium farcinogenes TaxID=1802 RepID=UPI001C8EE04A|nr:FadR/GntR family transcriptional regulator [Mycolicibacterium farcinogenes]QZH60907.1 FadR family transcriptional regulator [Mycolicibacterium farcinogenes]
MTEQAPSFEIDKLRRPRSLKMSEQIARHMVDFILSNELTPGTRLPVESELCRTLDVGRNTLREAMRLLEAWGVVEIRQGRNGGAVVRNPEPSDLRGPLTVQLLFAGATLEDILKVRLLFEPETAFLAAQNMGAADVELLDESVARMRAGSNGHDEFLQENRFFHATIAAHTGVVIFQSFIESIEAMFDGSTQGVAYSNKRRGAVADAHARIAKAIRLGDAEKAREEMRTHIDEAGCYWARNRAAMEKKLSWPQ